MHWLRGADFHCSWNSKTPWQQYLARYIAASEWQRYQDSKQSEIHYFLCLVLLHYQNHSSVENPESGYSWNITEPSIFSNHPDTAVKQKPALHCISQGCRQFNIQQCGIPKYCLVYEGKSPKQDKTKKHSGSSPNPTGPISSHNRL